MILKKYLLPLVLTFSFSSLAYADIEKPQTHFPAVMVVMLENMSYAELKNEPVIKKLMSYTGNELDAKGRLHATRIPASIDENGFGYAFFSSYSNHHEGGILPTRPSEPNYIALTSGSIQKIIDDEVHDVNADNIANELNDANVSWKIYAEDLPNQLDSDVKPTDFSPAGCFISRSHSHHGRPEDGYMRKHEPLVSYLSVQTQKEQCAKIVNSDALATDVMNMPRFSMYIPNQVNDGHNGTLTERLKNVNSFLTKQLGMDEKSGIFLQKPDKAHFKEFLEQGGLLVITFDEPSVTGNPDMTIFTMLIGKMVQSGAYPNSKGKGGPVCYPDKQHQTLKDANGKYAALRCNHYNLLKMIENNWDLRGLSKEHTSNGYKIAYGLDNKIELWK